MDHAIEVHITERLQAMVALEQAAVHRCPDYLSPSYLQQQAEYSGPHQALFDSFADTDTITKELRVEMIKWFYEFADVCMTDRRIVAYAVSFLDRYLSIHKCSLTMFRLVGTTCIYLAIKIHDCQSKMLPLQCIVDLWEGYFTKEDFESMEASILLTFNYRMHPVCPHDIISECLRVLKPMICDKKWRHIQNTTTRLCQGASMLDYDFVGKNPTSIGLGCIFAVLEGFPEESFPIKIRQHFVNVICKMVNLSDEALEEVAYCHDRLWGVYAKYMKVDQKVVRGSHSPVSIPQGVTKDETSTQLYMSKDCDEIEAVHICA